MKLMALYTGVWGVSELSHRAPKQSLYAQ